MLGGHCSNKQMNCYNKSTLLQQDYRTTLQGALVYDPELIEANEALAQLLIKDIVRVANGEKRAHIYRKTSPKVHPASSKTQTTKPHGDAAPAMS